jgi:upstream activation factor subunit UAF30
VTVLDAPPAPGYPSADVVAVATGATHPGGPDPMARTTKKSLASSAVSAARKAIRRSSSAEGSGAAAKKAAPAKQATAKKAAPATKATAKKAAPAKKAAAKKAPAKRAAPAKKRTPNAAFMKAMTPSPQLAAVVGDKPMPRTEVTKKVWDYIKKNKLQDAVQKKVIIADAKLKEVFGKARADMFEMTKLINSHLK